MDVPLSALDVMAEVKQLCIDSTSLFKRKFLQISQYYLVIHKLLDEASELPKKRLPEGVFLHMVGTKVFARSTD